MVYNYRGNSESMLYLEFGQETLNCVKRFKLYSTASHIYRKLLYCIFTLQCFFLI